jgi:hypothetical protein
MPVKNAATPIPLTSIDSTAVTDTYQAINTTGLPFPCFSINILNDSDEDITVSFDGVNDHEYIVSDFDRDILFQTNAQPTNSVALLPQGTKIYVKGTAGTGYIYLSGWGNLQGI